ncbi:hypothetical protein LguiA_034481 [Lonicera macranthoides]
MRFSLERDNICNYVPLIPTDDEMAEFELNIPPEVARPMLEKAWPQKFWIGKDKVKEAKLKRKSGEASSNTTENDELSEVFGEDKRGRARRVGSHVTRKQLIHLGIAKAKEEANKVEKEGINALKDEFKSYVQEAVKVQFQDFQLAIQGTMKNMMADFNHGSPHVTTPRNMCGSHLRSVN